MKYLLPCSCGNSLSIEPTQAGQALLCTCGRQVQAPSLQEIRRLDTAAEAASPVSAPAWGLRQRLILVGLVIMLAGASFGGWFFLHQPQRFTPQVPDLDVAALPPLQTLALWISLNQPLDPTRPPAEEFYLRARMFYNLWMAVSLAVVLAGGGIAASSFWVRPSEQA